MEVTIFFNFFLFSNNFQENFSHNYLVKNDYFVNESDAKKILMKILSPHELLTEFERIFIYIFYFSSVAHAADVNHVNADKRIVCHARNACQ